MRSFHINRAVATVFLYGKCPKCKSNFKKKNDFDICHGASLTLGLQSDQDKKEYVYEQYHAYIYEKYKVNVH